MKSNTSNCYSSLGGTKKELIRDKKGTSKRQKANIIRDKKITTISIKDKNRPFIFKQL